MRSDFIKTLGSKNRADALASAEAIYQVISAPLLSVIQQAPAIDTIYHAGSIAYLRAQKVVLEAEMAGLRREIDSLKDTIGC